MQAIAVTAELTGTQLSTAAARVMAQDLARYPEHQIMGALTRCRREVRSRLTIADVLGRIEDGRPGVEEAWSNVSAALGDEGVTVVWTEEEAAAFWVANALSDDPIAARMAFKEAYLKAVQKARDAGKNPKWSVCLGHNPGGREGPLLQALERGQLKRDYVAGLLPCETVPEFLLPSLKRLGVREDDERAA